MTDNPKEKSYEKKLITVTWVTIVIAIAFVIWFFCFFAAGMAHGQSIINGALNTGGGGYQGVYTGTNPPGYSITGQVTQSNWYAPMGMYNRSFWQTISGAFTLQNIINAQTHQPDYNYQPHDPFAGR